MHYTRNRRLQVVAASIAALFAAASVGSALAWGARNSQQITGTPVLAVGSTTHFPTNARGETYGSAAGLVPSNEPQLISAVGTSPTGQQVQGYVSASALNAAEGGNATTPQQALAAEHAAASARPETIPLYAENGVTVIGSFTLSPPQGNTTP